LSIDISTSHVPEIKRLLKTERGNELKKTILISIAGVVYGAVLSVLSFMLTGAGHGTYVLLFVSSVPVFWLNAIFPGNHPFIALFFGSPILWAVAGLFSVWQSGRLRLVFPVVMATHYLGIILLIPGFYGGWGQTTDHLWGARDEQIYTLLWFALYLSGQIALWVVYRSNKHTGMNRKYL
jgi:hypothetical protein